jgi:hypothetical protein
MRIELPVFHNKAFVPSDVPVDVQSNITAGILDPSIDWIVSQDLQQHTLAPKEKSTGIEINSV